MNWWTVGGHDDRILQTFQDLSGLTADRRSLGIEKRSPIGAGSGISTGNYLGTALQSIRTLSWLVRVSNLERFSV